MKFLIVLVGMLMALSALGQGWSPEPVYMLKPDYPKEMLRMRITGDVRVKLFVKADGSVADVSILYGSHPEFTGAILKVIRQWRFSPWSGKENREKQISVIVPLLFSLSAELADFATLRAFDLEGATCRQLNNEIEAHMRRKLNKPLANLKIFQVARERLVGGFIDHKYSSDRLAVALFELSEGMVKVVRTCQKKTSRKFIDALPEGAKTLLLGAVSVGAVEGNN